MSKEGVRIVLKVDDTADFGKPYIPEKGLFAGILERAVRDLEPHSEPNWRRQAIAWFTPSENLASIPKITFKDCIEALSLSAYQIEELKARALNAQKLEEEYVKAKKEGKLKAEGEQSRERPSQVPEREWMSISQENRAVLWGIRRRRRRCCR